MYLPKQFRQDDAREMHALMRSTRLATLVTVADGAPLVSHVPMLLDAERGPFGTLRFHLAIANPQARALADGLPALAIFLGPSAYITPSWYESKREHGKVVPTWAYTAVHASGSLRVVRDPEAVRAIVDAQTHAYESSRDEPWAVADAPESYVAAQLHGIVGVEFEIDRLDGKWKLGQNRSAADIAGVVAGLSDSGCPVDREVAVAASRARVSLPLDD